MASIRLNCSLCPRKPEFSDMSHLLTHLASKGHLSHYFRAQVKSSQNAQIAAELQVFDSWYNKNNMERLLHERLMQKEKRKKASETNSARGSGKAQIRVKTDDPNGSLIDPRLANSRSSGSKQSQSPTELVSPFPGFFNKSLGYAQDSVPPSDATFESERSTPIPGLARHALSNENFEIGENNECVALKGVVWPGMDLFDSASPQSKRIRNQKKDASTIEQMRNYAETIEPNEDIYYFPSWELKQSREITGHVESSSPERDPSPPPARAQRQRGRGKKLRNRTALTALDSNQQIRVKQPKERRSNDSEPVPTYSHHNRKMPGCSHEHRWLSQQEELDWSMNYDPFGPGPNGGRKRNFSVFRDSSSPSTAGSQSQAQSERDQNVEFFNSLFDPKIDANQFLDPYGQRYFSNELMLNQSQHGGDMPPYLEFLAGYQPNPFIGQDAAKQVQQANPLSTHDARNDTSNHLKMPVPNSIDVNPLLDLPSIVGPAGRQESDNETIDEGIEGGMTTTSNKE